MKHLLALGVMIGTAGQTLAQEWPRYVQSVSPGHIQPVLFGGTLPSAAQWIGIFSA